MLKYTDILLPNEREACKLAQVNDLERAAEVLSQKVRVLVIKRGSQGAMVRLAKEKYVAFPPVVDVADLVASFTSLSGDRRSKIA